MNRKQENPATSKDRAVILDLKDYERALAWSTLREVTVERIDTTNHDETAAAVAARVP
jgi:hypothetical protein